MLSLGTYPEVSLKDARDRRDAAHKVITVGRDPSYERKTARRAKQRCSQIFRCAIATDRAQRDVAISLRGAMAPVVARSHAVITDPTQTGALLRAILRVQRPVRGGERLAVGSPGVRAAQRTAGGGAV